MRVEQDGRTLRKILAITLASDAEMIGKESDTIQIRVAGELMTMSGLVGWIMLLLLLTTTQMQCTSLGSFTKRLRDMARQDTGKRSQRL